jgi:hypothetical protein
MNPKHSSKPLPVRAKIGMAKKPTDEHRSFMGLNVQPNQTVTRVA